MKEQNQNKIYPLGKELFPEGYTVKELIEKLKTLPQDVPVGISVYYEEIEMFDINEIVFVESGDYMVSLTHSNKKKPISYVKLYKKSPCSTCKSW